MYTRNWNECRRRKCQHFYRVNGKVICLHDTHDIGDCGDADSWTKECEHPVEVSEMLAEVNAIISTCKPRNADKLADMRMIDGQERRKWWRRWHRTDGGDV
jgi:hypothetical protein